MKLLSSVILKVLEDGNKLYSSKVSVPKIENYEDWEIEMKWSRNYRGFVEVKEYRLKRGNDSVVLNEYEIPYGFVSSFARLIG
ncbi:MAG: hypothetical protein RSC93_02280 [Erysipelotrichaceae bacterium]